MTNFLNPRVLKFDTTAQLRAEMQKIGADPASIETVLPKGIACAVKLEAVDYATANILKRELLAAGGDAMFDGDLHSGEQASTDVLLLGTLHHYRQVIPRLRQSLAQIAADLEMALSHYEGRELMPLSVGETMFEWGHRTYIMGIVNVTPDSFSGDGLGGDVQAAVAQAQRFIAAGADIIDVGGESTRPGSAPISAEGELRRVIPVLEALAAESSVPISIDTSKAQVAREALGAGASIVNDVWALRLFPELAHVVAEYDVPVILMHNRSQPKQAAWTDELGGRYVGVEYEDLMADIIRELRASIATAIAAGVKREQIIVDPGIGFGKTVQQNCEIINRLHELKVLGCPILVGPSRKSFIGYALDLPLDQRVEGTAAAVALSIVRGAHIVRVHDVQEMSRVASMIDVMLAAFS